MDYPSLHPNDTNNCRGNKTYAKSARLLRLIDLILWVVAVQQWYTVTSTVSWL